MGLLHAANPADIGVPPIRVRGSATIPLVFHPDNRVRNVTVRGVYELPYGLIVTASFFRVCKSIVDFVSGEDFKLGSSASGIRLTDESVAGSALVLADCSCILTPLTPDDGTDCSTPAPASPIPSSPSVGLLTRTTAPFSGMSPSWRAESLERFATTVARARFGRSDHGRVVLWPNAKSSAIIGNDSLCRKV